MQRSTTHVLVFIANDAHGNSYALKVFANTETTVSPDGSMNLTRGRPSIETQHGLSVERLAKGEYNVVATGLALHSRDPRAV